VRSRSTTEKRLFKLVRNCGGGLLATHGIVLEDYSELLWDFPLLRAGARDDFVPAQVLVAFIEIYVALRRRLPLLLQHHRQVKVLLLFYFTRGHYARLWSGHESHLFFLSRLWPYFNLFCLSCLLSPCFYLCFFFYFYWFCL